MEDKEVENIKKNLNHILDLFGWTEESLLMKEIKVQCPLDGNHMVCESALKSHTECCKWLKDGYSKEEMEKALPSSSFSYDGIPVILNKELLSKITSEVSLYGKRESSGYTGLANSVTKPSQSVPKTMDRFTVEFSPQERLAVYDYVVSQTKEVKKSSELFFTAEGFLLDFEKKAERDKDEPKSHLEILAEQRDYKRRRPTYRAKNVHITKKSYTEVMKEVIENQMSYLDEIQKARKTSHSDGKKQENAHSNHLKETHERSSLERESDYIDHGSYKADRYDVKSHDSSHRRHKRSRSRSRSRDRHKHSGSYRHKSSYHDRDKKHRKH